MSTFAIHNQLPNAGATRTTPELCSDDMLVWLLKESTKETVETLSGIPARKSNIRERDKIERLGLYVLALIDIGIKEAIPDLVTLTVNLRESESIGRAISGLRQALQRKSLKKDFLYAGVEVPSIRDSHKHSHLFILGIHPGTEEWEVLMQWKQGRNKRKHRSVLQKWSYSPLGWLNYICEDKNLGVTGAKIRHSTGKLNTVASDLSRNGLASFIERYEAYCATLSDKIGR